LAGIALFPLVAAYATFAHVFPGRSTLRVVLSLFYGFNPWVTAQVASGHVGVVGAYALLTFIVLPPPRPTTVNAVRLGLLLALAFALDPHMAVVATACVLSTVAIRRFGVPVAHYLGNQVSTVRGLVTAACVSAACSAYWLIPDAVVASKVSFIPVKVPQSISTLSSLARLDDAVHVAGLRSFWWAPFSNGFYSAGRLGNVLPLALMCGPLALLVAFAVRRGAPRVSALAALWVLVPLVLTQWAHHSPATYANVVSLPGGSLLRDPNESLPFAILGLCVIAGELHLRHHGWVTTSLLALSAAAALVPWSSGTLRGYLTPLKSAGSEPRTVSWLNRHTGTAATLWLPADPYIKTDWSSKLITDPVRFWTTVPVINPLLDPVYDFSPATTLATIDLESQLASGSQVRQLGRMLAVAGIRFVVVRRDAEPRLVTKQYMRSLQRARGVRLVRRFGEEYVFATPAPVMSSARISRGVTLFGGTWDDLAQAVGTDSSEKRTYVNIDGITNTPRLVQDSTTSIVIDDLERAALAAGRSHVVKTTRGRQRLVVGNELMARFDKGEAVSESSDGIFAAHVLGLNSNVRATCNRHRVGTPDIYQQPDVDAARYAVRWIGVKCVGTASLRFNGPVWMGNVEVVQTSTFRKRLRTMQRLMTHAGSAYMLHSDQFAVGRGTIGVLSRLEDLLFLSPGRYRLKLTCNGACSSSRLRVVTAASLHPLSSWLRPGQSFSIRGDHLSASGGEYRVAIRGVALVNLTNVYVERVARRTGAILAAATTTQSAGHVTTFATTTPSALTLPRAPAPWSIEKGNGRIVWGPIAANMYATVVGVTGHGQLSLNYLRNIVFASGTFSAAVLIVLLALLSVKSPEQSALWTRRGHAVLMPLVLVFSLLRWGVQRRPQRGGRRWSADSLRRLRPSTIAFGRTVHTEASTVQETFSKRQGSIDRARRDDGVTARLKRAEDALAKYRERESRIAETLLTVQNTANELRERAERDVEQERADAEELRRRAEQNRAEFASDEWLERMRTQVLESMRLLQLNTPDVLGDESRAEDTEQKPAAQDETE
jgi:hypothetical protein